MSKVHRRWQDGAVLLLLYLAIYSATIIMVFVLSRLRLPALAVLMVFASAALAAALRGALYMVRALRKGDLRSSLTFAIVPLVILLGWAALGLALKSRDDHLLVRYIDHYNLGTGYEIKGRYGKAIQEYEAAIERAPFDLKLVNSLQENIRMLRERMDPAPGNKVSP